MLYKTKFAIHIQNFKEIRPVVSESVQEKY